MAGVALLLLIGCVPRPASGPAASEIHGGCKSYYPDRPPVVVETAIVEAFGYLGATVVAQAARVACCESGWGPQAANGQYLGLMQLGANNYSTMRFYSAKRGYAPGVMAWSDPWVNAQTARDVYVTNRNTWIRWSCKP